MSGHVGDLSPQQVTALKRFKALIEDIPNKPDESDHYYLRWLRARRFDVEKAETMFRNHIEYRKKFGADTILTDYTPPEVLIECVPGGFFGEDIDGHPVWYDNFGNLDSRGLIRSSTLFDFLKFKCLHHVQLDIKCKEFSEQKGKLVETITLVIDFENISFKKHYHWPAIEMLKEVLATEEANNPERSHRIILLKTPSFFPFCYNIVKHILDEKTKKKVVVIGISSNWKDELQKYISPDQLPAMYGGNRYEPDAECSNYICPGRDVHPKYYLTNQTKTSMEDMERVVVRRGASHKVQCEVTDVRSTLRWEFFTTGYDIAFGISIKKKEEDKKCNICPLTRVNSHLAPQVGQHCCLESGTYVIKFDNSFSWTRSKELFYSVKILPPDVDPKLSSHTDNLTHPFVGDDSGTMPTGSSVKQ